MINVSADFKKKIQSQTDFREEAVITLLDGTVLSFDWNDFSLENNSYSDGAGANSLPLGCVVGRTANIELWNGDGHLNSYDFFGASVLLKLSFRVNEDTIKPFTWFNDLVTDKDVIETITLGVFTVIEPETLGETVIISVSDDTYKTDKPYDSAILYPTTAGAVFRDACTRCGLTYDTVSFRNDDFVIESRPENVTYRQVIGYVAMLAAGNARINRSGKMEILTYNFGDLSSDQNDHRHELSNWCGAPKVDTSDIVITGVKTTATVETNGESTERDILCGTEGYVIAVENPLIAGKEQSAVNMIGEVLVGATFRKFEGDHVAYPLAEFMDQVKIIDRRGRVYYSVITDISFVWFGKTSLSNSAAPAVRNNSTYQTAESKAVVAARKLVAKERTARESAVAQLQDRMDNSGGLYSTDEVQQDGSIIHYLHDKPTLAESTNVIKVVADAIGFSVDGGETFPFGVEVSGDVIARILSVIGINADWINVGHISTEVVDNLDVLISELNSAISDAQGEIRIASTGIDQNLRYIEALRGELRETQGYIRTGIVDYDGNNPVIGIAIGQDLVVTKDGNGNDAVETVTINGVEHSYNIIEKQNFRAIYTAKRLAFWEDGVEVAYVSNQQLYITDVVALASLKIGVWSVKDEGDDGLTFKWIGGAGT